MEKDESLVSSTPSVTMNLTSKLNTSIGGRCLGLVMTNLGYRNAQNDAGLLGQVFTPHSVARLLANDISVDGLAGPIQRSDLFCRVTF
jgi:hypothetical protein